MIRFLTIGRVLYDKGFKELLECASYFKTQMVDLEFQWLVRHSVWTGLVVYSYFYYILFFTNLQSLCAVLP